MTDIRCTYGGDCEVHPDAQSIHNYDNAPPVSPLMAQILSANASQLAATTNAVIDSLTRDRDDTRAELALVRSSIENLISGKWMPTTHAIEGALYPSQRDLEQWKNLDDE